MGEDTCIYVLKKDIVNKLDYFDLRRLLSDIDEFCFGGRWYVFCNIFHLNTTSNKGYYTIQEIINSIAGKKVKEEYVNFIMDLKECDCIIQGDYIDFPKDRNEEDYIDLTILMMNMTSNYFMELKQLLEKKK
jgi:hypothetical protein